MPNLVNIVAVATGNWHTLALDATGKVYSAGNAKNGELARQGGPTNIFCEIDLPQGVVIESIHAGFGVSFIIDTDGNLYSFGSSKLSTHSANVNVPTLVTKVANGAPVRQVDLGMNYAMCVTRDGRLFAWGNNTFQ